MPENNQDNRQLESVDAKPIKDLFDHFYRQWLATDAGHTEPYAMGVRDFLDFTREAMKKNMPIGVDHTVSGLGMRMQDGSVYPMVAVAEVPQPNGSMSLSPGQGQGGVQRTFAMGITG